MLRSIFSYLKILYIIINITLFFLFLIAFYIISEFALERSFWIIIGLVISVIDMAFGLYLYTIKQYNSYEDTVLSDEVFLKYNWRLDNWTFDKARYIYDKATDNESIYLIRGMSNGKTFILKRTVLKSDKILFDGYIKTKLDLQNINKLLNL